MKITNFTQQTPAKYEMPYQSILTEDGLDRYFSCVKKCVDDIIIGKSKKKLKYFPGLENIIREGIEQGEYRGKAINSNMRSSTQIEKLITARNKKKVQYAKELGRLSSDTLKEKLKNGIGNFEILLRDKEHYVWEQSDYKVYIDGFEFKLFELYNIIKDKVDDREIKYYEVIKYNNYRLNKVGVLAYYLYGIDFIYKELGDIENYEKANKLIELSKLDENALKIRLKDGLGDFKKLLKNNNINLGDKNKLVVNWENANNYIEFEGIQIRIKEIYELVSKFFDEDELKDLDIFKLRTGKSYDSGVLAAFVWGKEHIINEIKLMKSELLNQKQKFLLKIENQDLIAFKNLVGDFKNLIDENGYFISLDKIFIEYGIYIKNKNGNRSHAKYYIENFTILKGKYKTSSIKNIEIQNLFSDAMSKRTLQHRIIKELVFKAFGKEAEEYYNSFEEKREILNDILKDNFDYKDKEKLKIIFPTAESLIGDGKGKDLTNKKIDIIAKTLNFSKIWFNIRQLNNLESKNYHTFSYESTRWLAVHLYGDEAEKLINSYEKERQRRVEEYNAEQQKKGLVQQDIYDEKPEKIDPKQEIINSLTKEQLFFIKTDLDDLEKDWIIEYRNLSIEKIKYISYFPGISISEFDIDDLREFHKEDFKGIEDYIKKIF